MFTSRSTPIAILVFSIVLAFGIKRYYGDQDPPMILESHLGPSTPIASYVSSDSSPCSWERIAPSRDLLSSRSPDTTAVILNWSRLPNVKRIASLLCGSYLDGTIATVYIWNNSPHKLSERDFPECPADKLKVYNSPSNLYFQARFLACADATTPYCFIQDDDYLILPEIIYTLRSRLSESSKSGIHLLPSHEMLSSQLRTISTSSGIHTSFAWLGYGAIIHRWQAVEFLGLLEQLNVTQDDIKMADNYFTILGNVFPEIWFDQGIELGGGQAFTVGNEGEERNRRHIMKASHLLDSIASRVHPPHAVALPYVQLLDQNTALPAVYRTPCAGVLCLFETNIPLLSDLSVEVSSAGHILQHEAASSELLDEAEKLNYLQFPLSKAVDGRSDTAFCTLHKPRHGDYLMMDHIHQVDVQWSQIEMVFLVDVNAEAVLRKSGFSSLVDDDWVTSKNQLSCRETAIASDPATSGEAVLRECSVQMFPDGQAESRRFFRTTLEETDARDRWCIYEMWLRGSRLSKESRDD